MVMWRSQGTAETWWNLVVGSAIAVAASPVRMITHAQATWMGSPRLGECEHQFGIFFLTDGPTQPKDVIPPTVMAIPSSSSACYADMCGGILRGQRACKAISLAYLDAHPDTCPALPQGFINEHYTLLTASLGCNPFVLLALEVMPTHGPCSTLVRYPHRYPLLYCPQAIRPQVPPAMWFDYMLLV